MHPSFIIVGVFFLLDCWNCSGLSSRYSHLQRLFCWLRVGQRILNPLSVLKFTGEHGPVISVPNYYSESVRNDKQVELNPAGDDPFGKRFFLLCSNVYACRSFVENRRSQEMDFIPREFSGLLASCNGRMLLS